MSKISIVIRSRENEDLTKTIESIKSSPEFNSEIEIIVISYSKINSNFYQDDIHFIKCDAKRIEAKLIGVQASSSNIVLFLDSDQTISNDLIYQAIEFKHDFGFVPERSSNNHLMSKLMDIKRIKTEDLFKKNFNIYIPVIPRIFRKQPIEKALHNLGEKIVKNVTETEDSLIFYELLKITKDGTWLNSFIYNFDPSLKEYLIKSFSYGSKNESSVVEGFLRLEHITLIRRIQIETLINNRSYSIGMFLCNMTRGIPYLAGTIYSRLKRW